MESELKIHFNDLGAQWVEIQDEALPRLGGVLRSGGYIGGQELERFEEEFSQYTGRKYGIGVSNGTDALKLAIQALECSGPTLVVMPANTYIAAPLSVIQQYKGEYEIGLVDIDEYYLMDLSLLEEALIENRDKYQNCILMPTHLYGHPMDMPRVSQIAEKYNCYTIEDASQAHGAISNGEMVGSRSDITVYSLYPGKGLGAAGDAGIITTDNEEYSRRLKSIRNYGSTKKYIYDDFGWNHRLDSLQAVILSEKLKHLDRWNQKKCEIADIYSNLLSGTEEIQLPKIASYVDRHVFHIYCVQAENREGLIEYLNSVGIPTIMHYPIPIEKTTPFSYLQTAGRNLRTKATCEKILSLPIHPFMDETQVNYVAEEIKTFYRK
jgi:dTDP-4-amino-4,6-dideoxygalactose transaminase